MFKWYVIRKREVGPLQTFDKNVRTRGILLIKTASDPHRRMERALAPIWTAKFITCEGTLQVKCY